MVTALQINLLEQPRQGLPDAREKALPFGRPPSRRTRLFQHRIRLLDAHAASSSI